METFTNQIMSDFAKKITEWKDGVIKQRLIDKGFGHLVDAAPGRFPKILCVHSDGDEHWYADDGTAEGVLIVSFYPPDLSLKENSIEANYHFK